MKPNRSKRLIAAGALVAAGLWTANRLHAFNPQPDPPAFAAIQMLVSETARLYAHCSGVAVRDVPPGPCTVTLLFLDQQGVAVKSTPAPLMLRPGQTGVLELRGAEWGRSDSSSFVLTPYVVAAQGSRVVPAVQLADSATGKTVYRSGRSAPELFRDGVREARYAGLRTGP